jgi:hypothetical protein
MERRNPAASLTDDLVVEILRRLPVRSVCRSKRVCRSWRNLIATALTRQRRLALPTPSPSPCLRRCVAGRPSDLLAPATSSPPPAGLPREV